MKDDNTKQIRESGIEGLKIIAIFLIIISHVVQTLSSENPYITYSSYILDLSVATGSMKQFILVVFRYFGILGNAVFLICSCWFLLRSSGYNKKKWVFMLTEVWLISMVIFLFTGINRHGAISWKISLKSVFPTLFYSNWYLTCYILFYPIHPLLNKVIISVKKQTLLRLVLGLFLFNMWFSFLMQDKFFASVLILWINVYFGVAYIQLYLKKISESKKVIWFLFAFGWLGLIGSIFITGLLGKYSAFFENKLLYWAVNGNPFLISIGVSLFLMARQIHIKNQRINKMASYSMLVYIIHENLILRTYYRPWIINYIHQVYGYQHIILWVLFLSVFIFLLSIICAWIYDKTIRYYIKKISIFLYEKIRKRYLKFEQALLHLD